MFFSIRRPSQTRQEDLKGFNLQILCIAKFKVLLIKWPISFFKSTHCMISTHMRLLFNIALLEIFEKIPKKLSLTELTELSKFLKLLDAALFWGLVLIWGNAVFSIFVSLKVCKYTEYELYHKCFPINFSRNVFLQNTF